MLNLISMRTNQLQHFRKLAVRRDLQVNLDWLGGPRRQVYKFSSFLITDACLKFRLVNSLGT
jgi:hypothetical protein